MPPIQELRTNVTNTKYIIGLALSPVSCFTLHPAMTAKQHP